MIRPIYDNILLQPLPKMKNSKTKNGILLPETTTIQDKPGMATVVACPENTNDDTKIIVKVNDIVIFNKFAGIEFVLDEKEYILIKQKDILAIID